MSNYNLLKEWITAFQAKHNTKGPAACYVACVENHIKLRTPMPGRIMDDHD